MGEFSLPFFGAPFSFFSYPSNIEIIFDFSDISTKLHPHFKILDPPLDKFSVSSKMGHGIITMLW